jgi:hypothetical protein
MRRAIKPVAASSPPSVHDDATRLRDLLLRIQDDLHRRWQQALAQPHRDDDCLPPRQPVEDALVDVGRALERTERGRYGCCGGCARPIELERLIVHPAAERCWSCQQNAERATERGQAAH